MSGENFFGFGDNDGNVGKKSKAWKAEGGRSYRVSFAWWNVVDGKFEFGKSPKFSGASINYIPGAGYIVNKGPEYTKLAGEPPKQRILTFLVIWPTDKKGALDKTRITTDFEVVPWVFSGDKYNQLKQIHNEFSFADHDVTLTCTDTGFQKMTFAPCKDSMLKTVQSNEKVRAILDSIVASVEDMSTKTSEFLGRELTIQQLREKMSGGSAPSPMAGGDAMTTANIDNVVDDLLG